MTSSKTLGKDLRALRKSRGLTLAMMAQELDCSVGWLSQVERDLSDPSVNALRQIAACLDVPVSILFNRQQHDRADEAGLIVRASERRAIGEKNKGLIEELLSPDLTDDFEMVHSTFEPHSSIDRPVTRATQEVGFIVSGKLDLTIAGKSFIVGAGDSFRIKGDTFAWANPYDQQAVAIWVIAPPVY